ncbi:PhzF family phenazine biosynthesis protein [Mobilitalea sibirica]|uniref:PhzF family phenazine biosynthesis protein n=1 Tax=Mobilitalea sibirica TaxID=1462919 RepID=UPI002ED0A6AB
MKYYVVDAFTKEPFHGNPAGVCLLEEWLSDTLMQNIAYENNLAETAFLVKRDGYYDLRWFTPEVEIDLCGHATLGSAFVLMNYVDTTMKQVKFHTKSGLLSVNRNEDIFTLDFPSRKPVACAVPDLLEKALGVKVLQTYKSRDLLVVVEDEDAVANLVPDFLMLKQIKDTFGFIITAKGKDCDFVSRFFAPNAGIDEDPVTGSSHTTLIPFWSKRLSKTELLAKQLSKEEERFTVKIMKTGWR